MTEAEKMMAEQLIKEHSDQRAVSDRSKWTHSICQKCWDEMNPGRVAIKATGADLEKCCFCGMLHDSCIYVRRDPAAVACNGVHDSPDTGHESPVTGYQS